MDVVRRSIIAVPLLTALGASHRVQSAGCGWILLIVLLCKAAGPAHACMDCVVIALLLPEC